MSWDISICRFSKDYEAVSEIPETESAHQLGTKAEVAVRISQIFTGTDWSDPSWGIFDSPIGSIEFNMGPEEACHGFMLHVRAGEAVVPYIVELCLANGWQGVDCSSGEFIEKSHAPANGQRQWLVYRNQIVGQSDNA